VAWVGVNEVAGPSELENGPHEPISGPTTTSISGVDLAHIDDKLGEASSGDGSIETEGYHRKETETQLVVGSELEPSLVLYSVAAAVSKVIRSNPVVESEPDKCKTSLISTVSVDLALEDTNMESRDDTMSLTVLESRQELIASTIASGLELVLRSDDNQFQLLDSPECAEVPPLLCVPLAIIEPLDQEVVAPGITLIKGNAHSKWVNRQYRALCKLVGFPIDSHEQECLELLRRIEETRAQTKGAVSSRKLISPASKGNRELKNLISSVNYDGKRRVRC
jgi:hypothetical protein